MEMIRFLKKIGEKNCAFSFLIQSIKMIPLTLSKLLSITFLCQQQSCFVNILKLNRNDLINCDMIPAV